MATTRDAVQELFVIGARNLHAVEKQALSILTPQAKRVEHYPDVVEQLHLHIEETNRQIARLDEILAKNDAGPSGIKELGLSLSGGMAAIVHSVAGDEILKNSFANYAFEHFEIAGYRSLITLAEDAGETGAIGLLRESLGEEERMARWLDEALPTITRRYATLYAEGGAAEAKV